jgi:hypothetical protein
VLAADVYATIARLAEEDFDADLLIDSFLRLGYCQRNLGGLAEAETAYSTAGKIAKRQKQTARELRSQIGVAIVVMTRGNLPKADQLLDEITLESERLECLAEQARALHVKSTVAYRRGAVGTAVRLAYDSLQRTEAANERDMILADLGAYLIAMNKFEAARDALVILEATTASDLLRSNARVNMLALAARSGDEDLFRNAQGRLAGTQLTAEAEVNYLIESARGLRRFGEPEEAQELLVRARDLAAMQNLNRSVFEAEEMLADRQVEDERTNSGILIEDSDSAAVVEQELRKLALAIA